jgi:curli biogenesis system outer membrane secretion channel CsgG
MRRVGIFALAFLIAAPLFPQTKKIGLLPFDDAAGVGPELGRQVAVYVRSELLKSKKLMPKFIAPAAEEGAETGEPGLIDVEKALELGRANQVDFVLIGTILEAEAEESDSSIGGISLSKASVGSTLRKVKATITIQGDLLSVADGTLVQSFEAKGDKTDARVGADLSTDWGDYASDSASANTPNAKALREAVESLVKQILKKI